MQPLPTAIAFKLILLGVVARRYLYTAQCTMREISGVASHRHTAQLARYS